MLEWSYSGTQTPRAVQGTEDTRQHSLIVNDIEVGER